MIGDPGGDMPKKETIARAREDAREGVAQYTGWGICSRRV
jgi:hypothetical protein